MRHVERVRVGAIISSGELEPESLAEPLSFLSTGRFGALYDAGFVLAGAGLAAAALAAPRRSEQFPWVLAGLGGLAPSRGTTAATLQNCVHLVGMLLLLVGGASALVLSAAPRWLAVASVAAVATSITLKVPHLPLLGAAQRLVFVLLLAGAFTAVIQRDSV